MRARRLLAAAGAVVVVTGCGGSPPPAPPPPTAAPVAPPAAPVAAPRPPAPPGPAMPGAPAAAGAATAQRPPLIPGAPTLPEAPPETYQAKGRRDPFKEIERTVETAEAAVATARLTGILRGTDAPLALIETQDGIGYILRPGDTIGNSRLIEIGADTVVFSVPPAPGSASTRVVLKLAGN